MALANTGKVNTSSIEEISIPQTNSDALGKVFASFRLFRIVITKFVALISEDALANHIAFIMWFADLPGWNVAFDKGGYSVQPVPVPYSVGVPFVIRDAMVCASDQTSNASEAVPIFGKASELAPSISGTTRLPKPFISIGISI